MPQGSSPQLSEGAFAPERTKAKGRAKPPIGLLVATAITSVFLSVFLLLLVMEGMLALKSRSSHYDTRLDNVVLLPEYNSPFIFKFKPNSITVDGARLNNYSLRRTTDITPTPEPGTVRILSYGDSIGWGYLVNDRQTYPYLLEQLLNEPHLRRYEVLNMARGFCPSTYVMHLKRDVPELQPRYVIMEIELSNDTSDEALTQYSHGIDQHGFPENIVAARYWPRFQYMPPLSLRPRFWETLRVRGLIMRMGRGVTRLIDRVHPNPVFSPESDTYYYNLGYDRYYLTSKRLSDAFDRMFYQIRAAKTFCDQNRCQFLLMIMPSRYMFYENQYRNGAIRLVDKAKAQAQDLNIPYVSMERAFAQNGGASLFIDFCHPTPKGYEVVARTLFDYIRQHNP